MPTLKTPFRNRQFEEGYRARFKRRPLSSNPYIAHKQTFHKDDGTNYTTDPRLHRSWNGGWWTAEYLAQYLGGPGEISPGVQAEPFTAFPYEPAMQFMPEALRDSGIFALRPNNTGSTISTPPDEH